MDADLNEQQQMLKKSARDFLQQKCPTSLIRTMEADERGYPPELWREMADMGWLGLPFEERYGGSGEDLVTLAVLLEELGRVCNPTPYFTTVVLGGLTIQDLGTEEQKRDILPKIARGDLQLALAITEPNGLYTPEGVTVPARRTADGFVVNGTKLFVENAHIADYLLAAVRTADGPDKAQGISLLLVDGKSPGVSLTPLKTMPSDKQFEVAFSRVSVPGKRVLGQVDHAWPSLAKIIQRAAVLQCAMQVGIARKVLEETVQYVKMRVQFGKPIGTFQAVQHYCANMVIALDGAWLATYEAIWRLSVGLPADQHVAIAKAWTGESVTWASFTSHQLHGGVGFMMEFDLQLYTRRAKAMELKLGTPDFYREQLAQALKL